MKEDATGRTGENPECRETGDDLAEALNQTVNARNDESCCRIAGMATAFVDMICDLAGDPGEAMSTAMVASQRFRVLFMQKVHSKEFLDRCKQRSDARAREEKASADARLVEQLGKLGIDSKPIFTNDG